MTPEEIRWKLSYQMEVERSLSVNSALRQAQQDAYEECAKLCDDEKVSGETGTEGDEAYNMAIDHCIQAIRALKDKS